MDALIEVKLSTKFDFKESWLENISFKVPQEFLEHYCTGINGNIRLVCENGEYLLNIDSLTEEQKSETILHLRTRQMFTEIVPLSSKLPFSYHFIPPLFRSIIAKTIGRINKRHIQQWAYFPKFPLDLSTDAVSDLLGISYKKLKPTPVILTHDIESMNGLKKLLTFLKEDESVGAKSTNFIVPFKWQLDHGILSEVRQRGHELGIHGFDHSNKTAFMDELEIKQRLEKIRYLIEKYDMKGYRSPSLLRTKKLLRTLSGFFKYDSSIPTSGGLFPIPNNGCASARIFEIEGICELPLSMPQDSVLLFLGYKTHGINDIWIKCADMISKSGGIIVLLTHCEKHFSANKKMISIYREILSYFRNNEQFTFKTGEEVIKEHIK